MGRVLSDAKRLLLGQDGSENTPLDFKEEIAASIKSNIIDKAKATLLITARNVADKLGKDIDKKQIDDVSGKGSRIVKNKIQEKVEEIEFEDIKQKRVEENKKEERRRKKEESLRQTMQRIAMEDEKQQMQTKHRQKDD